MADEIREAPAVAGDAVPVRSVKEEIQALLDTLPDDVTWEDVQYHIYVVDKIRRSEARAEKDGWVSNEDARKRLSKWLDE